MIKISVIVPVWNVEEYLDRCLRSIINQSMQDIEIIVVNDGSPDNSQRIIDEYLSAYPTIVKCVNKENGGIGSARNAGLGEAKGEFISFVDSDDYIVPHMMESLYSKAIEAQADLVVCNVVTVDDNNSFVERVSCQPEHVHSNKLGYAFYGTMACWNKLYRKDLLLNNKIEFRIGTSAEDFDFTIKAFLHAQCVEFSHEYLYFYQIREGSLTHSLAGLRNRIMEMEQAAEAIVEYCQNQACYDHYHQYIEFLVIDRVFIAALMNTMGSHESLEEKKQMIAEVTAYMFKRFPNYKKNVFWKNIGRKRIVFHFLIVNGWYFLANTILKANSRYAEIKKKRSKMDVDRRNEDGDCLGKKIL
ncbi:MAG: glycosyltransferase [Peptococcaceae bacterium]|nr:glycosyltransferase [Peptococcaceae bacterium]